MASPMRVPPPDSEVEELRTRLREAEETLQAIRSGAVDAIVVEGPSGRQVFTLQGAERPYRVLAETMNEGAASLSADGCILFCNRRLAEILGVEQSGLLGASMRDYIEKEQRPVFERFFQQARVTPQRGEFDCPGPRGKTTLLFSLSALGRDGAEGICLVATDLTEQKKLEQALENFAARLSRSNEELSQFAYIASHDLQEPLRHIVAFGDMLRENSAGMSAEAADCAERMQKAARRMAELIEALLQYSRACGPGEGLQDCDLAGVVAEVLLDLHEDIRQRQARITVEALPRLYAEPLQMRQLLRNLIGNALKFQRADTPPQIEIGSRALPEGDWEISVQDNGVGFEASAESRIFRPFQRLHSSRYPGAGIGLAICQRIVHSYGGSIRAHSEPGCGSTFFFTLPKAKQAAENDDG